MNTKRLLMCSTLLAAFAFLLSNRVVAQSGTRFLDPVFDEVVTTEAVPFSSTIREGETTPPLCTSISMSRKAIPWQRVPW